MPPVSVESVAESVARILALIGLVVNGCAAEHRSSGRGVHGDVAAGRSGEHAARVDRVDGDVGAIGGVGDGAQLGAIFLARLRDPAREFNQRLSSGNSRQHIRETFDGRKLLVGVEHVEFGFIGRVRGAGIFLNVVLAVLGGGVERVRDLRGRAGNQLSDGLVERGAIVGEIREHREARAEHHHGNQIGGRHLLLQKFLRCRVRAENVVRLHRSHVEEQDDHAAVADRVRDGVGAGTFVIHGHDDRLGVVLGRGLDFFDIRIGEAGNLLLLAVVGDFELIGAQSLDRLPGTVGDLDIDADNIGLRAENERGIRWRSPAAGPARATVGCCADAETGAKKRPAIAKIAFARRKTPPLIFSRLEPCRAPCLQGFSRDSNNWICRLEIEKRGNEGGRRDVSVCAAGISAAVPTTAPTFLTTFPSYSC